MTDHADEPAWESPVAQLAHQASHLCPCGHLRCMAELLALTAGAVLARATYPENPVPLYGNLLECLAEGHNLQVETMRAEGQADRPADAPLH